MELQTESIFFLSGLKKYWSTPLLLTLFPRTNLSYFPFIFYNTHFFSLGLFLSLSLSPIESNLIILCPRCTFLHIFLCSILRFLDLCAYGFHQIWKFLAIINPYIYFFCSLISLDFFGDSNYCTYIRLKLSKKELINAFFIKKNVLWFYLSFWIISLACLQIQCSFIFF